MNELEEHCEYIERLHKGFKHYSDLWIILTLQSTTHCLIRRMEEHEDFKKLVELIKDPRNEEGLLDRASTLWTSPSDPKYAHPMDIFLAIYINALSKIEDYHYWIWDFIGLIRSSKSRQFFNSKCVAQSLCDKKYKDVPIPTDTTLVRCRVCNSMTDGKRCVIYKYTSRYVGDGSISAPKLFSLCEDCLREGLDSINEKCTG